MGDLSPFFSPTRVAVIGASREPGKVGYAILSALKRFPHAVPVNPKTKRILGRKSYASVLDIPGKVDLAVIAIPQPFVEKVINECAEKGVQHAVIITAGYGEVGNHKAEKELLTLLNKHKIRAIGPNCLGVLNAANALDTLFLPPDRLMRPKKGMASFFVQSGAVGSVIVDLAAYHNLGIAKFASYGNAIDVSAADLIEFYSKDKETKAIVGYIEGIKDGKKFIKVASACKKPLIILKGGLSEEGSKAAASHTGSLAGSARIYEGVFRQTGVLQAENLGHVFELLKVFDIPHPRPKGKRTLIITDGGGIGITAADALSEYNIPLAKLNTATVKKLQKKFPPIANIRNPLDVLGDADAQRYLDALDAGMQDKNVDAVMFIVLPQVPKLDITKFIQEAKKRLKKAKKPVVVVATGAKTALRISQELGSLVPVYEFPEEAARALKGLFEFYKK